MSFCKCICGVKLVLYAFRMPAKIKLVALSLIVAGAAIALLALREFRRQQSEADDAYSQVMQIQDRAVASRRAIAALEDAELREQNYVLTGEVVYLEAY